MRALSLCLVLLFPAIASSLVSLAAPSPQDARQTNEKIYQPKEVDRRARITQKSMPQYTEKARRNHTSGWVVLSVVLKSSGEIGDIKVIRDLQDGLTEECIRAARETKFEPAMKDGIAVSQYSRFEYTFSTD